MSGSPGFCDTMSAAGEHAHCSTTINYTQLLAERNNLMVHVNVVDWWEDGKFTRILPDAK